jgi:uncharacterized protein with NAD-binding domain and iron-sulfur cluster
MKRTVLIIGGGVAGLTAAHELVSRGYAVTVIEPHKLVGGKAKSTSQSGSGVGSNYDLPGEHGFRIFPGFYRHLIETMCSIPYDNKSVADNLRVTKEAFVSDAEHDAIVVSNNLRGRIRMFMDMLSGRHYLHRFGITQNEIELFFTKLWQVATSCQQRRDYELDAISWWEFTEADTCSEEYREQLVINSTKTLVASDPRRASVRTIGVIAIQTINDLLRYQNTCDRVLCGPTNDVWMDPWYQLLRAKGVTFTHGYSAKTLTYTAQNITGVECDVHNADTKVLYTADYYVLATPIEVSAELVKPLVQLDDQFVDMQTLSTMTSWMNGIQFYLFDDVPIVNGHEILTRTRWALTAISQAQFWTEFDLTKYGDGTINGIISVDISEWRTPGLLHKKPAMECRPAEVAQEVWYQLKQAINSADAQLLTDENLHSWFLDPDIQRSKHNPHANINLEPLLVNLVNSWELRPLSTTKLTNLFLAADYVKNNTDLATMEGANEAAKRSVNAILDSDGSKEKRCAIYPLHEFWYLRLLQSYDRYRYNRGLPWTYYSPLILRWPVSCFLLFYRFSQFFTSTPNRHS